MKIKLMNREIELIIVDDNAEQLNNANIGNALIYDMKIYQVRRKSLFVTIHELMHFFIYYSGQDQQESYSQEAVCDIAGHLIDQLVLENGINILNKIKKFLEKE